MNFNKLFNILLCVFTVISQTWGSDATRDDSEHQSQRVCVASPMSGPAFAKLMTVTLGNEEDEMEIISMLQALSGRTDITGIETIENESLTLNLGERRTGQKYGFMDCKCLTKDGKYYIIEVQIGQEDYWDQRASFYVAKTYGNGLAQTLDYSKLKDVIAINLLGFRKTRPALPEGRFRRTYELIDTDNQDLIQDTSPEGHGKITTIKIIQYELPNVTESYFESAESNELASWLRLFKLSPRKNHELPKLHPTVARAARKRLEVSKWFPDEQEAFANAIAGMSQEKRNMKAIALKTAIDSAFTFIRFVDESKKEEAIKTSLNKALGEETAHPVIVAFLAVISSNTVDNSFDNVIAQMEQNRSSSSDSSQEKIDDDSQS